MLYSQRFIHALHAFITVYAALFLYVKRFMLALYAAFISKSFMLCFQLHFRIGCIEQ